MKSSGLINVFVFILCFIAFVLNLIAGRIGWSITEAILAILQLPFAIAWLKEMMSESCIKEKFHK